MNKDDLYNQAYDLFEEKNYGEAIELLKLLSDKYPKNLDILNLHANCLLNIFHFTDAARILQKAQKAFPKSSELKYNFGYALLCMGRIDDAMTTFNEALQMNPPKQVKVMINRMIKNKKDFDKHLENNYPITLEEEFECYDNFIRAQKLLYSGKEEEAIELYQEILDKKPGHIETLHNIGAAYFILKDYKEALKCFIKVNEIKEDMLLLANLAITSAKTNDIGNKDKYIIKIKKSKEIPAIRDSVRIAVILFELGEFELTEKLLKNCRRKTPHLQLDYLYAVALAKLGWYKKAKKLFFQLSDYSEDCIEDYLAADKLSKNKATKHTFKPSIIFGDISVK